MKALVYVAAFAPDTGESVAALLRRFPGSTAEANTTAPILLADGSRDLYIQPEKCAECAPPMKVVSIARLFVKHAREVAKPLVKKKS